MGTHQAAFCTQLGHKRTVFLGRALGIWLESFIGRQGGEFCCGMIQLESDHLPTINPTALTAGANAMTKASRSQNLQMDLETIPLLSFVRVAD